MSKSIFGQLCAHLMSCDTQSPEILPQRIFQTSFKVFEKYLSCCRKGRLGHTNGRVDRQTVGRTQATTIPLRVWELVIDLFGSARANRHSHVKVVMNRSISCKSKWIFQILTRMLRFEEMMTSIAIKMGVDLVSVHSKIGMVLNECFLTTHFVDVACVAEYVHEVLIKFVDKAR